MKKLMFILMLFVSSAYAVEVHVEDCGAYAESNSRDVKQISSEDAPTTSQGAGATAK